MSRPAEQTKSPWLIGISQIAGYAQAGYGEVNRALLSGALEGRQRRAQGVWRSRREWVDAWIDSWGSSAS